MFTNYDKVKHISHVSFMNLKQLNILSGKIHSLQPFTWMHVPYLEKLEICNSLSDFRISRCEHYKCFQKMLLSKVKVIKPKFSIWRLQWARKIGLEKLSKL